jgi:hypothetical protein
MAAPVPVDEELWEVQMAPGDVKRMTLDQLDDAFRLGLIAGDTLIRELGQVDWLELSLVADLDSPSAIPPEASALSINPEPTTSDAPPSSDALTPTVALLPNVAVLSEAVADVVTPVAPPTTDASAKTTSPAEAAPAAADTAAVAPVPQTNASVRLTAPGLSPTPSILGAQGAASLGPRSQPRPEPAAPSPKPGAGARGRPAQRSSSAIHGGAGVGRPGGKTAPAGRGATDNATYSRLRPSGPPTPSGTPTAKASTLSPGAARGLSTGTDRLVAPAGVSTQAPGTPKAVPPPSTAVAVSPLLVPEVVDVAAAPVEVANAPIEVAAAPLEEAASLVEAPTPAADPADGTSAATALAARAAIPSLPPNAFAHLFAPPPETVQQVDAPPFQANSERVFDSLPPEAGPFREALAAYPTPAGAWATPYSSPSTTLLEAADPAPVTAPIGSFLPPSGVPAIAPVQAAAPSAFAAAPFAREQLDSVPLVVPNRLSKFELSFWVAASLLCLTVVLQRNGVLHDLSKAMGNEPNYLQIERSLLGAPDLSTPRGVNGIAVVAESKSDERTP